MFKSSYLRRYRIFSIFMSLIFILGTLCGNSAVYAEYTEAVKSVEIQSPEYAQNTPGSWHIDKSAEWIGNGKAKVTLNVNTIANPIGNTKKDVILVLDVSGSMAGEKLNKVKADAKNLIETLFQSNSSSRLALISFSDNAQTLKNLSGYDKKDELIDAVDNLDPDGNTNYY